MGMPRYAARRDKNQPEIVEALEAIGVYVWTIELPVDLLCLCMQTKRWFFVEVKNPEHGRPTAKQHKRSEIQQKFFEVSEGALRTVVQTVDDAISYVQIEVRGRR